MEPSPVIDTLNALRRAEATSLLARLTEAGVYIGPGRPAAYADLQRMIDEEAEHLSRLDEAVLDMGGNLAPCAGDIRSANLHYLALEAVLPRVLANQRRLAEAFEAAAPRVTGSLAAATVARIAASHRDHARRLDQLLTQKQGAL